MVARALKTDEIRSSSDSDTRLRYDGYHWSDAIGLGKPMDEKALRKYGETRSAIAVQTTISEKRYKLTKARPERGKKETSNHQESCIEVSEKQVTSRIIFTK